MKRIMTCAGVGVLTGAALLGGTSGAQAAYTDCPSTYFCAWTGNTYTGTRVQWVGSVKPGWPSSINNKENSVYNHGTTGYAVVVYDGGFWNDPHYCVKKGIHLTLPTSKDNDGESHQWMPASSVPSDVSCLS